MVVRTRLQTVFVTLALYLAAAGLIGYFGFNAYTGNRGLKARQDLMAQLGALSEELAHLKAERGEWQRRVALLRSESLDPDMLDERARAMLDYVHGRDLVLLGKPIRSAGAAIAAAR
ncbi:MAG TPA: septum formation initiator family protein [Xanthobacteraceae bacterium]|jgi:cell division protein FtsB